MVGEGVCACVVAYGWELLCVCTCVPLFPQGLWCMHVCALAPQRPGEGTR